MIPPGAEVAVTLDLQVKSRNRGTVAFLGVKKGKVEGAWIQGGQRPDFFWTSPEIDLVGAPILNAPLPEGLTFFAVVNQDGDPLPGTGDLTSGPVAYEGGGRLTIPVDGRFGETREAPAPAGGPDSPRGAGGPGGPGGPGELGRGIDQDFPKRPVTIDVPEARRPKGATVLMVIGREPAPPDADGKDAPDFFWRSDEFTPTVWPHPAELPLPTGMAARVLLDADGDGMPSAGDLATPLDDAFARAPATAPIEFVLDEEFSTADFAPRAFEDALQDEAAVEGGAASAEGGEPRTLKLSTEVRLPFIRTGRFMVVGLPPAESFEWPPAVRPAFLWVSQPTKLNWPVELEAQVPDGLDLIVVLDLDGSGYPDTGDLSSKPAAKYARGAADAPIAVELEEVIPVPEAD